MRIDHFRLMFEYERWANRRALESLRAASECGGGVQLLAHILAAQEVWLTRLQGRDSSGVAIFPERGLEGCEAELERLTAAMAGYLASLTDPALDSQVTYQNQTGREFRNTPLDILTHLGLHSQHHRGQIAMELRKLGAEPAVTDFIAFRRL